MAVLWMLSLVSIFVAAPCLGGAPSCNAVACPPDGATTAPFCEAVDGQCSTPPDLPKGFTVAPGTSISIPLPDREPFVIPMSDAVGAIGHGKLCCAVVATAATDVTLFRAWAPHYDSISTPPPGYAATWQFGSWWSADQPDVESHSTYRTEEDICVSWSSLAVYTRCTLPQGSQVFIGPGQSACCPGAGCDIVKPEACPGSCPNPTYLLESDVLQIWVPDWVDPATGEQTESTQRLFSDCETFVWPAG